MIGSMIWFMSMSHHYHPTSRRLHPHPLTLTTNHGSNHSGSRISNQVSIKLLVVLPARPLAVFLTVFDDVLLDNRPFISQDYQFYCFLFVFSSVQIAVIWCLYTLLESDNTFPAL